MSAPLVVNTTDGMVWTRRSATRNGEALYALAEVVDCPDMVMATYAELVEHGIAGTADVLPVPAGPSRFVSREDPHDSPLHHDYATSRDLPARECAFKNPHAPHTNEPGRADEWQCPGVPRQMGGASSC